MPPLDLFCCEPHFPVGLLRSHWKMGWKKGQDGEKILWTLAEGSRTIWRRERADPRDQDFCSQVTSGCQGAEGSDSVRSLTAELVQTEWEKEEEFLGVRFQLKTRKTFWLWKLPKDGVNNELRSLPGMCALGEEIWLWGLTATCQRYGWEWTSQTRSNLGSYPL